MKISDGLIKEFLELRKLFGIVYACNLVIKNFELNFIFFLVSFSKVNNYIWVFEVNLNILNKF